MKDYFNLGIIIFDGYRVKTKRRIKSHRLVDIKTKKDATMKQRLRIVN